MLDIVKSKWVCKYPLATVPLPPSDRSAVWNFTGQSAKIRVWKSSENRILRRGL